MDCRYPFFELSRKLRFQIQVSRVYLRFSEIQVGFFTPLTRWLTSKWRRQNISEFRRKRIRKRIQPRFPGFLVEEINSRDWNKNAESGISAGAKKPSGTFHAARDKFEIHGPNLITILFGLLGQDKWSYHCVPIFRSSHETNMAGGTTYP